MCTTVDWVEHSEAQHIQGATPLGFTAMRFNPTYVDFTDRKSLRITVGWVERSEAQYIQRAIPLGFGAGRLNPTYAALPFTG